MTTIISRIALQSSMVFISTEALLIPKQSQTFLQIQRQHKNIHFFPTTRKSIFNRTFSTSSHKSLHAQASSSSSGTTQQTLATLPNENNNSLYYEAEQTIKKSRFIGIAKHCTSWDAAQEFIQSIRAEHPKARHVCFGFVCGTNPVTERASDDGEPTGTAGVPILGGINGEELSDTVCVVVRYSGGIKLGAGGLIRAYGGTARLVLRVAERDILIPMSQVTVRTPSSNAGNIYLTASKCGGVVEGENYLENGDLEANIICESEKFDRLIDDIRDATKGDVIFDIDES